MKLKNKRKLADQVLKVLKPEIKKLKDTDFKLERVSLSIGSYQNGREQGHSITMFGAKNDKIEMLFCFFSEHRNSDNVVVYTSLIDPIQGITEEMYKNALLFKKVEDAVKYILEKLTSLDTI